MLDRRRRRRPAPPAGWYLPDRHWLHRLVRAEVDLDLGRLRFYALRRREPTDQPLIGELPYEPPARWYD